MNVTKLRLAGRWEPGELALRARVEQIVVEDIEKGDMRIDRLHAIATANEWTSGSSSSHAHQPHSPARLV